MPRLAQATASRDVAVVHRLEFPFPINYLCYASWGACFAVGTAGQLLDVAVLAAVVVNLLLTVAGLALNSAVDIRTDERHQERSYLASAARRFGRSRTIRWAATETVVALLLAGLVSVWLDRYLILAAAAVIVVLQVLYNVDPVRLKRRGLTGVAAFCASVLVLPFLLSYWAVRPDVDPPVWLIVVGLGILAIGRMTLWSIPDLAADATTGMRTPSVRYGSLGALALSFVAMISGIILTGWGLWWLYGPVWALPLVAVQATSLYGAVVLLRHPLSGSVRIRRRAMPPVMISVVAMTVAPLIAA
jgi:4-hydroxybenzoate polyprenyltransferase